MPKGPAPRPKRGGEEFARTRYNEDGAESKKPRFDVRNPSALVPDAPEEDAILEADEIGKRGQQTKRNAVNIDGYDSDSSTENFDARAEAKSQAPQNKKQNGGADADDEQDIFAEDDDEVADETKAGSRKAKKAVSFVDVDDIQGQVNASKSGGHVSADFRGRKDQESSSDSDSDVDDTVRAEMDSDLDAEVGAGGKKKHAPKLDAFNLRAEKEDGGFDEQLNYVRKAADPDAVHDTWLQGLSKKDMRKAREAQDRRDQERRQKTLEDDALVTSDILTALIRRLEPAETVLEALARLGRGKSKREPKWKKKKKQGKKTPAMDLDVDSEPEDPIQTRRLEDVEAITEAADRLLSRGQTEVYDTEREVLMRQYRRETGQDWTDPQAPANAADENQAWEYRWADARDGGEIHGPYDASTMVAWNDAGYFGDGVEFRKLGIGGASWTATAEFS